MVPCEVKVTLIGSLFTNLKHPLFHLLLQKCWFDFIVSLHIAYWFKGTNFSYFGRFNKSPLKGVKYLQEQGLLEKSPEAVAQFLMNDDRLDKVH